MNRDEAEKLAKSLFKKQRDKDRAADTWGGERPRDAVGDAPAHDIEDEIPEAHCPDKLEPPEEAQNITARERVERQISDIIASLNVEVRTLQEQIKEGLDDAELARNSIYTEPLTDVEARLRKANSQLQEYFPEKARMFNSLANVVMEIMESESE